MTRFPTIAMLSLIYAWLALMSSAAGDNVPCCQQVNSFIGTGGPGYGYGGVNPGAQYPFGALRLGPDTTSSVVDLSFRHFSGYHYLDDEIRGFSHTHFVGAGTNDLGSFGFMPIRVSSDNKGPLTKGERNGTLELNGWTSKFQKESEKASPGYYSVYLDEPKVRAEMLAVNNWAGIHRYTWDPFTSTGKAGLVLDICHASKMKYGEDNQCKQATITAINGNTFEAAVSMDGSFTRGMWFYIYGEISTNSLTNKAVKHWEMCASSDIKSFPHCQDDSLTQSGVGTLFTLATFGTDLGKSGESAFTVDVRVAISLISGEYARKNFADAFSAGGSSVRYLDFEQVKQQTTDYWCTAMSNLVSVTPIDGDVDFPVMMHSANYRSMLSPTIYTESGGVYMGFDGVLHNATAERIATYGERDSEKVKGKSSLPSFQYEFFSDFSLWDTFRTVHPWLLLTNEDASVGFARSMAEMTAQQGAFPKWPFAHRETGCMLGISGVSFIVDMVTAGLSKEVDIALIQKTFLKQCTTSDVPVNGRTDLSHYLSVGYVTQDVSGDSTSETLTYAFDDYLLGRLSEIVGDTTSAQSAYARSKNYQTLWSSDKQFFCPRYASGDMSCPKTGTSYEAWEEFREGDALHWMWFVPHDVQGLISLFPSPQAYDDALSTFFVEHLPYHEKFKSAAPNPYYWAGNEHDFLAPYMFNYGPNCTNTQYWSRLVNNLHFSNTPHGNPGNEDYGAMSTWFMFSSLGLFPNTASPNAQFLVGSPRVKEATVTLKHWNAPDSTLHVITYNNSPENVFVQKLLVNGVEYREPFIDRSVLADVKGVTLEFYMTSEPVSTLCKV